MAHYAIIELSSLLLHLVICVLSINKYSSSYLWVDNEEDLDKFWDEVGVCKVVCVAEHGLQPGDQGGRTRAGDHLEIRAMGHQVLLETLSYGYASTWGKNWRPKRRKSAMSSTTHSGRSLNNRGGSGWDENEGEELNSVERWKHLKEGEVLVMWAVQGPEAWEIIFKYRICQFKSSSWCWRRQKTIMTLYHYIQHSLMTQTTLYQFDHSLATIKEHAIFYLSIWSAQLE